ncbi:hypothetical protein [Hymenobacter cavernae]|uniref:hypothetical protein n=1 Tax=Hymenobacter cavernae TaxID=2044852 RepID=UPI00166AFE83|nr:hypothetical protein [Hymenobacter cavernae]
MNYYRLLYFLASGPIALILSACSVYRPSIPQLPAIRAAHQAEVKAGVDANGFMGLGAAYSPVKYVLVTAAGSSSWHSPNAENRSGQTMQRQGQISAGAYLPLGSRNVVSVTAGTGMAHSFDTKTEIDNGFLSTFPSYRKEVALIHAHTRQKFLQVGWQYDATRSYATCHFGVAYRIGSTTYSGYDVGEEVYSREDKLLSRQDVSYALPNVMRQDVWAQFSLGSNALPALLLQFGLGVSVAPSPSRWQNDFSPLARSIKAEHESTGLGQASLVFYPHLLRKRH